MAILPIPSAHHAHSLLVAQPPSPDPISCCPRASLRGEQKGQALGALLGVRLCAALPHRAPPFRARALFPTRTSLGGPPKCIPEGAPRLLCTPHHHPLMAFTAALADPLS